MGTPQLVEILHVVRREGAIVPFIWRLEVVNILGINLRNGKLTASELEAALDLLGKLPVIVDSLAFSVFPENLIPHMQRYNLSAYDASYLELAIRSSLPIATLDRKLRQACHDASLTVFPRIS